MKSILRHLLCQSILLLAAAGQAGVQIRNLTAVPRWPWNGKVDITFSVECTGEDAPRKVALTFTGKNGSQTIAMKSLTGTGATSTVPAGGPYTVTWDAGQDAPGLYTESFSVQVNAVVQVPIVPTATYIVVDLSGGPTAAKYPVRYTSSPPALHGNECRTTELWLRRIPAGSFIMGSPEDEPGHEAREARHPVTISGVYYIGIFECTQKQWELVMGTNPSYYKGDVRPVEQIRYTMIRGADATAGAGWPAYGHAVDDGSFLGRLSAKTGLVFDLPTEAQWEYACRAGTTTSYHNGRNLANEDEDYAMQEVGRYAHNVKDAKGLFEQHTKVGSYKPNAWGLYDMHGNVWEWCLDWYDSQYPEGSATDPHGPATGTYRVLRGGDFQSPAKNCRAAKAVNLAPSGVNRVICSGFRIVLIP